MARDFQFTTIVGTTLTPSISASESINHTFQVKFTMAGTEVTYNAQGSLDGVNFFDIESSDVQKTAAGTYYINKGNAPLDYVRFNVVSTGGGTIDMDVFYKGDK